MIRPVSALLIAAAASGCASYRAAPLAPEAIAVSYARRALDPGATQRSLTRVAPNAPWDGQTWDRMSLFAAALELNPRIAEARAHARSAEASARAARAGPSITLTVTAEYARSASEASPWLYGVTSDVPLDIGARRSSRISAADFSGIGARFDYAEVVWGVRMALRRALAERFLAAREVQIGEELSAIRARQLAAIQARFDSGEAARADLERVRTEAAGDARRLTDAQARLMAARIALADALGVSINSLENVPLTWTEFDAPVAANAVQIELTRQAALLARSDILRASAAYDQSEADLRGEVARQWPELHFGPGYTWERGLVKLPFSIGLVLPPLDFNHNAVEAAEARRSEAGLHLEAIIASAQSSIDAALAEQATAVTSLARVRSADLSGAHSAADQADEEIASGAIDRVDWCAAQASLRLAQLAEVDALRRVHAADAALEDALRRPLEGPELAIAPSAAISGETRP
ncbi:heavy metal RND efflux outer membrane protein of CzcC family [alpha proteobacterium U9-1i]|nr:heavy metal RND efflux outer membrane protein of CzcC family [alpha proteobacterium U9-1i]